MARDRTARHQAVLRALDDAVQRDVLSDWRQYGIGRNLRFELQPTSAAVRPPMGPLTLEHAEGFAFGVAAARLAVEATVPLCRACREDTPMGGGADSDYCSTCIDLGWTDCPECGRPRQLEPGSVCDSCGHVEPEDEVEGEPEEVAG